MRSSFARKARDGHTNVWRALRCVRYKQHPTHHNKRDKKVKMLGRGVQVALLVLVGCRVLGGLRGKLGKKSRERRRLAQEAEMVMSELANADHYLKDNFEATPEAKHSVRSSDGAQLSPSLQGLSARSKNTEACRKLSELERLVERRGGFPPCAVVNGDLDRTLLRFLIASDYDVGRAADAVDDLKVWRRDERIDSLLGTAMRSLSAQKQNALRRCMPSTYHGRDLRGHPIHLEQTGRYNWDVLRHCEPEDLVRVHILAQEYQSRVSITLGVVEWVGGYWAVRSA